MGLYLAAVSDEQLSLERAGIWRPIIESLNEETMEADEFLVRYWESAGGQVEFVKRLKRNQALAGGSSDDAVRFQLIAQRKALVQMCLAGWRTVLLERTGNDEDPFRRVKIVNENSIQLNGPGDWVEYSDRAALQLTTDKWRKVFNVLSVAANADDEYQDYLEDVAKNLPSSSDGNSKTSESSNLTSDSS